MSNGGGHEARLTMRRFCEEMCLALDKDTVSGCIDLVLVSLMIAPWHPG